MTDDRDFVRAPGEDYPREWMGSAGFDADWVVRRDGKSPDELSGLDQGEWSVLAIDLLPATRPGTEDSVYVYALREDDIPAIEGMHPNDALKAYVAEHGSAPVTKFHVPGLTVQEVFAQMKTGTIQLRAHGIRGMNLHVVSTDEAPGQSG
ncbi:hypothetical protein [Mycobacteroides abscessus]|uniref:hypothetical protein n=1 Tax=Mycobacteroides abscessus TaxID=36809 RepID=UPI0009288F20|nr:hypothetical protein [Mycobacteroides abscessus]MBN7544913.1 hypothetical protein [Mycobacteroides abscessus subsp. abscessus]QSM96396.1 hypothetical protein I3U31_12170 [Mycobacteroides abscessus subsp. abscessus]QSN01428.1 hypothetical protein I3U40_12180 [Mycobacteroides abscessus subsp. abscessus]SHU73484.1 Uncharacterised protein [Mycobacteroides abscessus subsp. abscessus]SHV33041.1 Uncharacterised protein [Mycobacteroides abscessus subsp. abscessus]